MNIVLVKFDCGPKNHSNNLFHCVLKLFILHIKQENRERNVPLRLEDFLFFICLFFFRRKFV